MYVSQQNGIIYALTIVRNGANNYAVIAKETISNINQIPNHNDNGVVNTAVKTRQVTGILVTGTATKPVLYVSSSDSRIGGPSGDLNLDTNSGIISRLTKNGSSWTKVDLVRGLPRSEENHANNGMQLDAATNTLFVAVGGSTNAGSPSTNFAYTVEYALSAAIISINLNTINSMSVKGSGNTAYIYDLPTVDDPTRSNTSAGVDVNDPFGGNDGLNQAKIVPGGPVQIYSPGYRNAYDLVITKTPGKAGRMYTIDNGANKGWGGYPQNEGSGGNVTNNYVAGEPGSTTAGMNNPVVNNLDNLHYIGTVGSYVPGSYYGGHPTPIRANPNGAGLYTRTGSNGVFRTSKSGANPLPSDWPPVQKANPIEGDYQQPGVTSKAILTFNASTNGIAEYTGTRFDKILQGTLLAASYDGKLYKIKPTADGKDVTNLRGSSKINQELPFASGFGSQPLDVTTQGDNDIFPGTVWVATYGSSSITVFEPEASTSCSGQYNNADDDGDKYTNADEIDNGTNPCSAASKPNDNDGDLVSDLNDPDDDGDTIGDNVDYFPLDSKNGLATQMPVNYDLFNNSPGTGFFGLGFTGLMSNKKSDNDYINLFTEDDLIAGGAVGAFSVVAVSGGDAFGTLNNQENAFQFGVNTPSSSPFTVHGRMLGPFFNNKTPVGFQSQGIYIGTGDQDNYLKITLNSNASAGGTEGIQVVYENAGNPVTQQYALAGGVPKSTLDLYLEVNPANGTVQPKYARDSGQIISIGSPISVNGALLTALQGTPALAVGLISTSRGATPFTATWDVFNVTNSTVIPGSPLTVSPTSIHFFSQQAGTISASKPVKLTNNESTSTQITAVTITGANNTEFGHSFTSPITINAGASVTINVTFKPTSAGGKSGTLNIKQLGISKLLTVALDGEAVANPNALPKANAGLDVTITLPTNSVILKGSGTDSDGSITGYNWSQIDGPNTAVFNNPAAQSPTVSGLIAGKYVFSLTIKDNLGANSAPDLVSVTVNSGSSNGQQVVSFTLMNADTEQEIKTITPGETINLTTLPTKNLNIRANTNPTTVGSVKLSLTGSQSKGITETAPPYALFGDAGGNYHAWVPASGNYTLTGIPYSAASATGTMGTPLTISFTISNQNTSNQAPVLAGIGNRSVNVNQTLSFTATASDANAGQTKTFSLLNAPNGASIHAASGVFNWTPTVTGNFTFTVKVSDNGSPVLSDEEQITVTVNSGSSNGQQVVSFTLMNADNEQEIKTITPGETINLTTLPTKNLNIRANTNPTTVGSVKLSLTGSQSKGITETAPPYALFGDTGGNYHIWVPAIGNYTLTGIPFSAASATGTMGTPLTITFTISNQATAARMATAISATEIQNLDTAAVTVYPNPFQEVINLQITSPKPEKYNVKVYDVLGQQLYQSNFTIDSPGTEVYSLDFIKAKIPHHNLYYIILESPEQSHKVFKVSRSW